MQEQAHELADWNRTLEQRVSEQLAEIERIGRLQALPRAADRRARSVLGGDERARRAIAARSPCVFCDLRGFTAFAETAEPEEVMAVLREYHAGLGALIHKFEGTLERFAGDGIMVLFNDPLPCADPALRAVRMAVEMRDARRRACGQMAQTRPRARLRRRHRARLCHARPHRFRGPLRLFGDRHGRQSRGAAVRRGEGRPDPDRQQGFAAIEELAEPEPVGELVLKGFHRPIQAFNVNVCALHP